MTIRRKRRQRGKRKELRREALKTWERLAQRDRPARRARNFAGVGSVILPMIRKVMPKMIANELVGIQPMTLPSDMIGNAASGIEPILRYRNDNDRTKKEIQKQRKKERKDKKRQRADVAKALRAKATS